MSNEVSNEVLDEGRRGFIGASLVAVPGAAVVSAGLLASGEASAQTRSAGPVKQPAVIGYPNKKGLQIERVTYPARNMVQQPQVDPNRIASLGICAGGSYALCNAQTELRVKAVAAVSTFNLGEARREGRGTISYEERMKRLKGASEARSREARGEPVQMVPVAPDSPASFTESTPRLYREGYDYYRTARAQHPNSSNKYAISSLPLQMAFFPFDQLETISPRPLLLIAGSKADTLFWSKEVMEKARQPKELFIVEGATHIDMYDRPQYVTPAVAKLKEFFDKALK